jgi:beta-1,4-N-acetylglucosaminyltransferase
MHNQGTAAKRESELVYFVASSGGHLLQLYQLRSVATESEQRWVTFARPDAETLLSDVKVYYAWHPTNRSLKNLLRNGVLAWRLLWADRPAAVVTTGAGIAVPFCWIGKLLGSKVIYIESLTRIRGYSLTGRLVYPVADVYLVQWPELANQRAKAQYGGMIVDIRQSRDS